MNSSLPGSSTHGILQPRTLEWFAISFSRGSSNPRIKPTSLISPALWGRFFTTGTIWESHTHTHTHTHTCVCVCMRMCATAWADAWETSCESQQRLKYEAISKEGHGTYYCCYMGFISEATPISDYSWMPQATPISMPEVHAGLSCLFCSPIQRQVQ